LGNPSDEGAVKFPLVVGLTDKERKCDGTVTSYGEIRAITPSTFQVTLYLGVQRNMTAAEEASFSRADASKLALLWDYRLTSDPFTREKLIYSAHYYALQVAASLVSASASEKPTGY
jgi:hypothetical protein